jgi:hypothetical protein
MAQNLRQSLVEALRDARWWKLPAKSDRILAEFWELFFEKGCGGCRQAPRIRMSRLRVNAVVVAVP